MNDQELNQYLHENVLQQCWHELNHRMNACEKCGQVYGGLRDWTGPDYRHSLDAISAVETRVIEEVGKEAYLLHLDAIFYGRKAPLALGRSVLPMDVASELITADADERARACKEAWESK